MKKLLLGLACLLTSHSYLVATTYTVDSLSDSAGSDSSGNRTLRWAISQASSSDTIMFSSTLQEGTITLNSDLPAITKSLTIDGESLGITINGLTNVARIFFVETPNDFDTVNISGLTLSGYAKGGAGGSSPTVTVSSTDYPSGGGGGGGGLGAGGALFVSEGLVKLTNITFKDNIAEGGLGGDGGNYNTALSDYTLGGNSGGAGGGGLSTDGGAPGALDPLTAIQNTIITGATGGGGGGGFAYTEASASNGASGGSVSYVAANTELVSGNGGAGNSQGDTEGSSGGLGYLQSFAEVVSPGAFLGTSGSSPGLGGGGGSGASRGPNNAGFVNEGETLPFGVGRAGAGGVGADYAGGGGGGGGLDMYSSFPVASGGNGAPGGFGGGGGGGGLAGINTESVTGGTGGPGGFGAGGGAAGNGTGGPGGFGGGTGESGGTSSGRGGNGASLGGAIFQKGGTISFNEGVTFSGNSVQDVTGADGLSDTVQGEKLADDLFIVSSSSLSFKDTMVFDKSIRSEIDQDADLPDDIAGALNFQMGSGNSVTFSSANSFATSLLNLESGSVIIESDESLGNVNIPLQFNGGTLQLGSVDEASSSTISTTRTFETNVGNIQIDTKGYNLEISSALQVGSTHSVVKTGQNALILSSPNTFSSVVTIEEGTLALGNLTAAGTGTINLFDSTVLKSTTDLSSGVANNISLSSGTEQINTNNGSMLLSGVISGSAGALNKTGSNTLTLTGTNTFGGGLEVSRGTLALGSISSAGSSSATITLNDGITFTGTDGSDLSAGFDNPVTLSGTPTIDTTNGDMLFSGVISGAGASLNKTGINVLSLTGANTFTGGIGLEEGTLSLGNVQAAGSGTITMSGDTTLAATESDAIANAITLPDGESVIIDTSSSSITLSGVITGTSGSSVVVSGSNNLTLNGENSFDGGITVNTGESLTLGSATAAGSGTITFTSAGSLQPTAALDLSGVNAVSNPVVLSSDSHTLTFDLSDNSSMELSGGLTSNSNLDTPIKLIGGGTLHLSGENAFDGIEIELGVLEVSNNTGVGSTLYLDENATVRILADLTGENAISADISTPITSGALGLFDTNSFDLSLTGAITGNGGLEKSGEGTLTLSSTSNTFGGLIQITQGTLEATSVDALGDGSTISFSADGGTLEISNTTTQTLSKNITGNNGTLSKTGSGKLELSGDNSFGSTSGEVNVETGALSLLSATALGSGNLTMGDATTLEVEETSSLAEGKTFSLSGNSATLSIADGKIFTIPGVVSGDSSLSKNGAGTLALSGANTFRGGLNIFQGTLQAGNDAALGQGSVVINEDSTLQAISDITLSNALALSGTSGSITVDPQDYAMELSGVISGTTDLSIAAGEVILSGINTLNSTVTLEENATAVLANTSALGTSNVVLNNDSSLVAAVDDVTIPGLVSFTNNSEATIDTDSYSMTISGNVQGTTGSLIKSGEGTLTLSGDNSYLPNGVTLSAGTLSFTSTNAIIADGEYTFSGDSTLSFDIENTGTFANTVSINDGVTASVNVPESKGISFSGSVTADTGVLQKTGLGQFVLTSTDNAFGVLNLEAGTVSFTNADAFSPHTVNFIDSSTLEFSSGFGTQTIDQNIAISADAIATLQVTDPDTTITASTAVTGLGSLTKSGAGILALTGTNTFSGGLNLEEGTLVASSADVMGSGALAFTGNSTLQASDTFTYAQTVTLAGGVVATVDTNGNDLDVSGVISGSDTSSIVKIGSGRLILSAENDFGGGVDIQVGTLILEDSSAAGSGSITIEDETILKVTTTMDLSNGIILSSGDSCAITTANSDTSLTLSGGLSGVGHLQKGDAGTLILSVANTSFSGDVTIENGRLEVAHSQALESAGAINITDGATLKGTIGSLELGNSIVLTGTAAVASIPDTQMTLSGPISGTGILKKAAEGTVVLSNTNNTFSGGIDLYNGILSVTADAAIGTGDIDFRDDSTLQFNLGEDTSGEVTVAVSISEDVTASIDTLSDMRFSGVISGDGALIKTGSSSLTLDATNTFTGGTTVSEGTLILTKSNSLGIGALSLADGTALNVELTKPSGAITPANNVALAGTVSLDTTGGGIAFSGNLSGTDAVLNILGDGGVALTGDNSGLSGSIAIQTDGSDLGLLSANALNQNIALSLATGTTVSLVNADVTSGAITGLGEVAIDSNAYTVYSSDSGESIQPGTFKTLYEDQAAKTFEGTLSGSGSFTKSGPGTLILTGDSSAFTGVVDIDDGRLVINGQLGGNIEIDSNGRLFGTGTISNLTNSGFVKPGNSIGTQHISGTYTQTSAGTLEIELGDGESDLVEVTGAPGNAVLDGTLRLVPLSYNIGGQEYTILTATGTITGEWATVDTTALPYAYTIDYDSDPNAITVTLSNLDAEAVHSLIYGYLGVLEGNVSAELQSVLDSLVSLPVTEIDYILNRMHPAIKGAYAMVLESNAKTLDSYINSLSGASLFTSDLPRGKGNDEVVMWVKSFRNQLNISATQDLPEFDSHSYALALGAEMNGIRGNTLGAYAGYQHGSISWNPDYASGEIKTFFAGGYQKYKQGNFHQFASLRLGYNTLESKRDIPLPSGSLIAYQKHYGVDWNVRAGVAYTFPKKHCDISPFVTAGYYHLNENGYTEKNAAPINLKVGRKRTDLLRSQLGMKFSKEIKMRDDALFIPSFNLAADVLSQTKDKHYISSFDGSGADFRVDTYNKTWFFASPSFAVEYLNFSGLSAALGYSYQVNKVYHNQSINARFNWKY